MRNLEYRIRRLEHSRSCKAIKYNIGALGGCTWCSAIVELGVGVAIGVMVGYWLDDFFRTTPLLLFICTIFGMIAGIYNMYRICSKH